MFNAKKINENSFDEIKNLSNNIIAPVNEGYSCKGLFLLAYIIRLCYY